MQSRRQGEATRHRIRRFILTFRGIRGYSPTIREIGEALGGLGPSVVAYHLNRLEEDGLITRKHRQPRTVLVTGPDPADDPSDQPGDSDGHVQERSVSRRKSVGRKT